MGSMSRPDMRQLQPEPPPPPDLAGLLGQVLRDPAQSEQVAQEVLLEIWRTASRYDRARGSAAAWALTIAHRRAVDRVRSENACSRREQKAAEPEPAEEDVAETVAATLEHQRGGRGMDGVTGLQGRGC